MTPYTSARRLRQEDVALSRGMTASMSRKANCWDNAPTKSFFNSLKNERVHDTRYANRADAEAGRFQDIEVFYNRRRRHSSLKGFGFVEMGSDAEAQAAIRGMNGQSVDRRFAEARAPEAIVQMPAALWRSLELASVLMDADADLSWPPCFDAAG